MKGRDIGGAAGTAAGTALFGPAGGTAGGFLGSILGGAFDSDEDYLTQAYDEGIRRYKELGMPPEEARPLILKELKDLGVPDAVLEEKMPKIISKLGQFKEQAEPLEAQKEALRRLSDFSRRGVTAEQEAAGIQAQLKADRAMQARLESQKQGLASRGLLGRSGVEQAMAMQAASAGGAEEAEERLATNRLASQMALEALSRQREAAGEMRRQDLLAAETTLGAQDVMARFGAEQQSELARRNIERTNAALSARARQRQRISESNIGQENVEALRQREAQQRDYSRRMGYAQGLTDLELGRAGKQAAWQDRESARSGEMGRGLIGLAEKVPSIGEIKTGAAGFLSSLGGGRSGGYDWSKGPSNPAEEKEADRAAMESLRRYGYPGSKV